MSISSHDFCILCRISYEGDILILGEKYGVIKKAGASYSYGKISIGRGYDKAREFLKENKETTDEIVAKIKEKAAVSSGTNDEETNSTEE